MDCLLRLSTGASLSSAVPHALIEEVSILWNLCQPVLTASATAEDAVHTVDEVYRRLENSWPQRRRRRRSHQQMHRTSACGQALPRRADAYRPVENLFYRGEMNADLVAGQTEQRDQRGSRDRPPVLLTGRCRNRSPA